MLIWSGRVGVWRTGPEDGAPRLVAELGPGDTFGDEALVVEGLRNATVKAIEQGEMLVLKADDFRALMSQPSIAEIPADAIPSLLQDGWRVVDVRYAEEFQEGHIPEALHLPLPELWRLADATLDPSGRYMTVCRSGKRSAVVAFLLGQRGYHVMSIKGGMIDWTGDSVYEV